MSIYVLLIVPLHFRLLAICLSQWHSCAKTTAKHAHHKHLSVSRTCCHCSDWLAEDKAKAIADEKRRIEEEEANRLVGPELPAGVSQQDMGDYGGALLPGKSLKEAITIIDPLCCFHKGSWVFQAYISVQDHAHAAAAIVVAAVVVECACMWWIDWIHLVLQGRVQQCMPLYRTVSVFLDVARLDCQQIRSVTLRTWDM